MGDRGTAGIYERRAAEWRDRRRPQHTEAAGAFGVRAAATEAGGPVIDLGCGPGWHSSALGAKVIALDVAKAMLDLVPEEAPGALRVQADLEALPLRPGSLGGAWASRSYVHTARPHLPLALADLHRSLAVGAPIELRLFVGDQDCGPAADDDFPGRRFSMWDPVELAAVLDGAGFEALTLDPAAMPTDTGDDHLVAQGVRARTLPDYVGPEMRLLSVGLNPSLYAADRGVGFARPGNRFWPAALAAGLVSVDRDPRHALVHHGVGMTDFVKRASVGAAELTKAEYQAGVIRLHHLVRWLRPGVVCVQGLAGWRAAVDRRATAGPIEGGFAGQPAYLMPNPSGLNASSSLPDFVGHLQAALALS